MPYYQIDTVIVDAENRQDIGPTFPFQVDNDRGALEFARTMLIEEAAKLKVGDRFTDWRVSRRIFVGRIDIKEALATSTG